MSDPHLHILNKGVSPLRIGSEQPLGELEGIRIRNDISKSSPQDHKDGRKRVSFSDESLHSLPPNGSCNNNGKRKLSPMPGQTDINGDYFEEDFFGVLNKVHATIERYFAFLTYSNYVIVIHRK